MVITSIYDTCLHVALFACSVFKAAQCSRLALLQFTSVMICAKTQRPDTSR